MAVIAVKSADSYRELDRLVAAAGLDPAASRPSLYQAAHTGNIESPAETRLTVRRAVHETHRLIFPDLTDAAEYPATSPKYDLPAGMAGSPDALAAALRARLPDQPSRRHPSSSTWSPPEAGHAPVMVANLDEAEADKQTTEAVRQRAAAPLRTRLDPARFYEPGPAIRPRHCPLRPIIRTFSQYAPLSRRPR